jgi:acyl-CoA synthetase (AMP-forming)/AMP-acid ligase II
VAPVIELIEAAAAGEAGIRFMPSGEERSFRQIWADSERVARWLVSRVGRGTAVGALLSNTPDCPAFVFGVWRSGNTLVSLPYPGRGADIVGYLKQVVTMCELSGAGLVAVDDAYRALLPDSPFEIATFQEAATGGPPTAADGSGGLIQFTSGSIGTPKGVVLSPEALAANILAIIEACDVYPGDTACSWLPLSHDMGFVGMFLTTVVACGPAYGGKTLVLQTPESFLADPGSWVQNCSDVGAALTTAPNFAFDVASKAAPLLSGIDLSRMRICITGAERVNPSTVRRFTETYAGAGLNPLVVCPAYGMAEAALAVTLVRPKEPWKDLSLDRAALSNDRLIPAVPADGTVTYVGNGHPVQGMDVRVVTAPGHDTGEVQIRGESMLSEYLGAELRWTDDGWYPTRDVGFLSDGELYLVGRADETIIVAGQNHYAADIEAAVSHDLIRTGCLAAVPLDEGYALVAEANGEPDSAALNTACREIARTASRAAGVRPALVSFIPRGRLPKTPSGKLQRLRVRAVLNAGDLEMTASFQPKGGAS